MKTINSKPRTNPKPATKNASSAATKPEQPENVDRLLASARDLYSKAKRAEKALLDDRIEIGRILLQLKELVGHGSFIQSVTHWETQGLLNFSLRTAERAMAYAELHAQGKFDSVSNLAEAEGIRKAECAKKKAAKEAAKEAADTNRNDDNPDPPPAPPLRLSRAKAKQKAQILSKAALQECCSYEVDSKRLVIEELIELLTQELES